MLNTDYKSLHIEEKLDFCIEAVLEIKQALLTDSTITVQEIADYWHVSKRTLYGSQRYLLPGFGEADGGKRKTYTRREFYEWAALGREELRRRYMEHVKG